MNWIRNKQQWRDYLLITLGTAVMAVATSSIYDPAGLVTGGFSGLAIVIKQLSQMLFGKGVPLWVTNLVLNIPLFLFGIRMSRDFLVKTIFGTLMNTFWIAVLPVLQLVPDDRMLSALFGGVLMGAGIGLVFIGNGTTGGTDMMAALIQRKLRHYSVAQVMQVLDGIIVIAGIFCLRYPRFALCDRGNLRDDENDGCPDGRYELCEIRVYHYRASGAGSR